MEITGDDIAQLNEADLRALSGFVPDCNTGFQVKKPDMPKSAIAKEMRPKGILRDAIKSLVKAKGAVKAAQENPLLYKMLASIDITRVGRSREVRLADQELENCTLANQHINISRIRAVSHALEELKESVVFVGVATVTLYANRLAENFLQFRSLNEKRVYIYSRTLAERTILRQNPKSTSHARNAPVLSNEKLDNH